MSVHFGPDSPLGASPVEDLCATLGEARSQFLMELLSDAADAAQLAAAEVVKRLNERQSTQVCTTMQDGEVLFSLECMEDGPGVMAVLYSALWNTTPEGIDRPTAFAITVTTDVKLAPVEWNIYMSITTGGSSYKIDPHRATVKQDPDVKALLLNDSSVEQAIDAFNQPWLPLSDDGLGVVSCAATEVLQRTTRLLQLLDR